jgi:hypothetical protein
VSRARRGRERLHHLGAALPRHEHARLHGAALDGVRREHRERGADHAFDAGVEHVGQVQRDALAAELEDDALEGRRRLGRDRPPDGRRPGERHRVDARVGGQDHRAVAPRLDDDVQHPRRQARLLRGLAKHRRLERRERARAEHDRASREEGRHGLPHVRDEREVVRRDRGDHPRGLEPPDRQADRGTHEVAGQRHLVVLPLRQPLVQVGQFPDARQGHPDLRCLGDAARTARLRDHRLHQDSAASLECLAEAADGCDALRRVKPGPRPVVEGAPGGRDRRPDLPGRGRLDRGHGLAGGRRLDQDRVALAGDPGAVHERLAGGDQIAHRVTGRGSRRRPARSRRSCWRTGRKPGTARRSRSPPVCWRVRSGQTNPTTRSPLACAA